ncbi:signal transduction histidine-protein kinase/phosphatase DegS [Oceanobacillus picturae]|jgi:two-component system, NarL family, sensor histidine kinase DegS|uniref:Signal transduction histidine-protein kinase/phosphatase DegS n=1 Tax=Oceanobacillus picturae TaxID=171693 RepID=W9AKT0_9BACI|nr:sensor histidine kinase [Oceanobacillus picturae]AVQ99881.1 histidine kinase [Oceanobacillus iheyensis]RIU94491.1 histidine kinase [Oceanobacillus picturae]GAQ19199.1 signal transduction histidine-protein kinase/phosphatase DegS [Oceanobacillus picturae]CDO03271.1 Signal transduction histidine-protein kinase/phosphatase DegS [Oceanobacillus picturae]
MAQKISETALDYIINEMIEVVENSKDEIFNISEEARSEHEHLVRELKDTKHKVAQHIEDGDQLEQKVRFSRQRLAEVSRYFDKYSENEIREVYENTHAMQTKLAMLRQEESALREKRDDLERRLISLSQTIDRAEGLAGKISVILNYLHDDFRQVNEMIEEAKEKQEFGLKIIEAQEDERRKISREIHDGPAQMLANILLRSELVDRIFRQNNVDQALDEIKDIRKMIRSSLYEVRRIIYDLRPMALDDLGLIPTIRKYVATIADYNNMKIEFASIGEEKRLNTKYEVAFFRLVQEALQNAVKHSEATRIQVKLEICTQNLTMLIKDNGKGFDTSMKRDKSFGLIGMRERVEMLEGKLEINSNIGKGTSILIKVPYTLS